MSTADVLHAAVVAHLKATLTTVTVHDGQVPDSPAADGEGRVYPYAVLWGAPGWVPVDARSLDGTAGGALTWPCPVTVAAGAPAWALQAVTLVRAALDGYRTPGGQLREEPGSPPLRVDDTTTPRRWYVPLAFRLGI